MKMNFLVIGRRRFNDTIDGQHHDFTKLVTAMDFPDGNNNASGQDAQHLPYGNASNYQKLDDVQFPCMMELDVNLTTKGVEVLSHKFLYSVSLAPVQAAPRVASAG